MYMGPSQKPYGDISYVVRKMCGDISRTTNGGAKPKRESLQRDESGDDLENGDLPSTKKPSKNSASGSRADVEESYSLQTPES